MESTGMFDKNGKEIFVGDTVKMRWGWWADTGEDIREHVITKVKEDNKIIFQLGNCVNTWRGEEVEKVFKLKEF
jgi:poly-D-alanine transfer protein DltD